MMKTGRMNKWMQGWTVALLLCVHAMAGENKPNVVFIMLDDFGYGQLEAFARGLTVEDCDPKHVAFIKKFTEYTPEQAFEQVKIASPTLSRMADGGVRFNNAFASSNLCAPARIGVATGILQNRWGIYRNIDTEAHGFKPHSHLVERFKELGYATAHIGKWHMGTRDRDMFRRTLKKHGIENPDDYDFWRLDETLPEIRKELTENGFQGSVVPKDHPLNNGFDYYFGYNMWECIFYNAQNVWENFSPVGTIKEYNTDVFSRKAVNFIEQSLDEQKPFFVQIHYHFAHHPLKPKAPEKYFKRFNSGVYALDNFYAHLFAVDENIRLIEELLAERGQAENTIFVFTSDHGGAVGGESPLPGNAPFSGHKGMLNLGGFRVPLFFYWPASIKQPLQKDQIVSTLDIMPTLIDAAGGTVPEGLDGKSLIPWMLHGKTDPVRDHVAIGAIHARVWGFNSHTSFFPHNESREKEPSGFIVADDRYILRYVAETIPDLYRDAVAGIPAHYELYDYMKDPGEQEDLVDQHPNKVKDLKAVWDRASKDYPRPAAWDVERWEAIVQPVQPGK